MSADHEHAPEAKPEPIIPIVDLNRTGVEPEAAEKVKGGDFSFSIEIDGVTISQYKEAPAGVSKASGIVKA